MMHKLISIIFLLTLYSYNAQCTEIKPELNHTVYGLGCRMIIYDVSKIMKDCNESDSCDYVSKGELFTLDDSLIFSRTWKYGSERILGKLIPHLPLKVKYRCTTKKGFTDSAIITIEAEIFSAQPNEFKGLDTLILNWAQKVKLTFHNTSIDKYTGSINYGYPINYEFNDTFKGQNIPLTGLYPIDITGYTVNRIDYKSGCTDYFPDSVNREKKKFIKIVDPDLKQLKTPVLKYAYCQTYESQNTIYFPDKKLLNYDYCNFIHYKHGGQNLKVYYNKFSRDSLIFEPSYHENYFYIALIKVDSFTGKEDTINSFTLNLKSYITHHEDYFNIKPGLAANELKVSTAGELGTRYTWNFDFDSSKLNLNYVKSWVKMNSDTFTVKIIPGKTKWIISKAENKDFSCPIYQSYKIMTSTTTSTLNTLSQVYPNPNSGKFHLQLKSNEIVNLNIYNSFGVKVYTETLNSNQLIQPNVAAGIYFIKINNSPFEKLIIN